MIKLKSRDRQSIELSLPFKSLPAYIKIKSTCSSKFVASSVPIYIYSHDPLLP